MSEWQPIETAPKDGTWFVAYRPAAKFGVSDRHAVVKWHDESADFVWPDQVFDIYEGNLDEKDDRGFYVVGLFESQGSFTHWMPLPAPPKQD